MNIFWYSCILSLGIQIQVIFIRVLVLRYKVLKLFKTTDPKLFKIVSSLMIHDPFGCRTYLPISKMGNAQNITLRNLLTARVLIQMDIRFIEEGTVVLAFRKVALVMIIGLFFHMIDI